MTKIQIYQIIALIPLVITIIYSYINDVVNPWLMYPLILINFVLWMLRLVERRKKRVADHNDDKYAP
ncbi:hypothetical protein BTS2_3784 [Bacillus sp. TS-2]|nr:hypothetical protein BTS2_3784 [Bacillus sp. TS-2]